MKHKWVWFFIVVAALVLVGCSPAAAEFTIEMTEFAYSPDTIEVSVGQEVTLNIVNPGALEHELMIGREVMMMEGQPANYEHNMFEGGEPMVMTSGGHEEGDEHAEDEHMEGEEHMEGDEHAEDEHMEGEEHMEGDEHAEDEHMEGDEHGHGGDDHGFMVSLPAGDADKVTTITFTVTEDMVGEWEIGCFLDGGSHYTSGMVGKLVVNP